MQQNLLELVKEHPNINITVKAGELLEMVEYCVQTTRKELEQQIVDANTETYPSRHRVAEILGCDLSTLYRHAKRGYLVPIKIGNKVRYKMSDVKRILNVEVK